MLTYPEWRKRRERRFEVGLLLASIFGPVAVMFGVATLLSLNCATVPPGGNIENTGNPADYPPLTDKLAPDAGR